MSIWRQRARLRKSLMMVAALLIVPACEPQPGQGSSSEAAKSTSAPDYVSFTDHFVALQRAGLQADYAGFATHLKAKNAAAVVSELRRRFAGQAFDTYTLSSRSGPVRHQRIVELRGTTGRLYIYLDLGKVTGGWVVAAHQIGRNRDVILAKL